jgi:mannitol-1-phosphate 5-dehydrogenase
MNGSLVLFGAGNIGRSFIGQVFARGGYQVVFVDIDERIVEAMNRRGGYDVVIKHPEGREERVPVTGVRAVNARDEPAVAREVAAADLAATAVGPRALPAVARLLKAGVAHRYEQRPGVPLDVILAENARDAASIVREVIAERSLLDSVGLVQTSIGKMVPIVPAEVAQADPLIVFAEPYNTLIVDAKGFLGRPPTIPEVKAVDDIRAYVDRKLFLHNLGHAAVAYVGHQSSPGRTTIAEAVEVADVREAASDAMTEAAAALERAYPDAFDRAALLEHRDDLLRRFGNQALADTVFRVGRDLPRKLARDDRVVGAMLLAAKLETPFGAIAKVYRDALGFRATDESGSPFPPDAEVVELARARGVEAVLRDISGLDRDRPTDARVIAAVLEAGNDRRWE